MWYQEHRCSSPCLKSGAARARRIAVPHQVLCAAEGQCCGRLSTVVASLSSKHYHYASCSISLEGCSFHRGTNLSMYLAQRVTCLHTQQFAYKSTKQLTRLALCRLRSSPNRYIHMYICIHPSMALSALSYRLHRHATIAIACRLHRHLSFKHTPNRIRGAT